MAGPWEKYQQQAADEQPQANQGGPWAKYQVQAQSEVAASDAAVEQGGIQAADFGKEAAGGALVGTGAVVSGAGDLLATAGSALERGARAVLPGGAVDALKSIPGPSELLFRPAGRQIESAGKGIQETKSEAAKQALKASTPEGDILDPSSWSMGDDPSLAGYGLQASNLIGQFVPQAAALAIPGGQARMAGMAGIGGLQAGGAAGNEVEERMAGMPDADLQQASDLYRDLRASGMAEAEARAQVSATARAASFQGAAPVGAAGGIMTNYALGPLQRHIGGGIGRRLAGGLLLDAPAEAAQEVSETVAARASTNRAIGERRDLTEDTFGDAVLGAMGGAGHASLGAVLGRPQQSSARRDGDYDSDAAGDATFEGTPDPAALPAPGLQGLPSPEQTFYADSQGNVQDTGPVRNVDGEMQPDLQGRQWVNPANDPARMAGGPGMDQQTARGEPAPLVGDFQHGSRQAVTENASSPGQMLEGETQQQALPEPSAIVANSEGNAQRGATAAQVFERPLRGGRGMDQQAPTATRSASDFEYIKRANGEPFQAHGAARASKAFREAKKAGRSPTVSKVDGGFAVRVPADPQSYQMRPIDRAAHEAATSPNNDLPTPTQAQIEAGNYKKGRVRIQGLDISIENPKGSERSGTDPDGNQWRHTMSDHYGYIKRTQAADGEQLDVYVGPQQDSQQVFVVDQVDQQTGRFDEHKVMLGYPDQDSAVQAYLANFDENWKAGPVTAMPAAEFKGWLKQGDLSQPLALPAPAARRDDEVRRADAEADRAEREDSGASFGLEQQTEEGLKEQAERNAAAEKAQAEETRLADRDRNDFTLTGSDRASDVAASRGQNDMFAPQTRGQKKAEQAAASPEAVTAEPATPASKAKEQAGKLAKKKPATEKPEAAKPAAKKSVIEDAGEKLGGARKDELRTVRERLDDMDDAAIASSTLSQLWPKGEVDRIADPFNAATYYVVRSHIPAKPRVEYKVRRWVEQVKAARDILDTLGKLGAGATVAKMREFSPSLNLVADQIELLTAVDRAQWGRIGEVRRATGRYNKDGEMVAGSWVDVKIDGRGASFYGHDSVASALPEIKQALEQKEAPEKKMKFAIYYSRSGGEAFITKDGDKERRKLKSFPDTAAARKYLDDHHDELVAAWDAVKNRDNVTKADMRRSSNDERAGRDYRNGKDVTPEQFLETFGFRGVEFGNWVKQGAGGKERQGILNDAYDAFMDLASVIGVPPKALSLDGKLGIGFGSRGRGSASAHYEPGTTVINMTKTKGAGSLAHEWFHALDNYFAGQRGASEAETVREAAYITYRPEPMLINKKYPAQRMTRAKLDMYQASHPSAPLYAEGNWIPDPAHAEGVRPKVEKAFAELVETLDRSPMARRSAVLDKGTVDGYWSRIIERGARSFETYVIAKLADQGARNDYLANVQTLEQFARDPGRYPYLTPDEQGPVSEAFDKLFATIETRETDSGIQMYRLGEGDRVSAQDIQGALAQSPELAGIKVVQSFEDLPAQVRARVERDGESPENVGGVFRPDAQYLVADNQTGIDDAIRTAVHEMVGHFGLRGLLGDSLASTLERIYSSEMTRATGRKRVEQIRQHYAKVLKGKAPEQQRLIVAEEIIAHLAEEGERPSVLQRFVSKVRALLRQRYPQVKWSYNDVLELIEQSREWLRSQQGRPAQGEKGAGESRYSLRAREQAPAKAEQEAQAAQEASLELPTETLARRVQRRYQDRLNRFTVIKQWMAKQGKQLSEDADVYLAEERMHSRFANKAKDFREQTVRPLVEKIQKAGYSMDDVAQYLHAQHAGERNAQIAKVNKAMPDGGSGMSNAEAGQILGQASPRLAALANQFREITDNTRKVLLDYGLIDKDAAAAWQKAYQHYVPLKGGPNEQAAKAGTGKGLSVKHKTKRALGHDVREGGEWIIENIIADHERALMAAEKNLVGQHLLKMALEVGVDDIMTIARPEKRAVLKDQVSFEVTYKGQPLGAFNSMEAARTFRAMAPATMAKSSPADFAIRKTSDPSVAYMASPMPAPNEALVYVDGHVVRVQINDDLLARAYNNMGADALGTFLSVGRALNQYFSSVYTGYNPEFFVKNVARDFTTGLANITGEEGAVFAAKTAKNYFSAFGSLILYAFKGAPNKWIDMYRADGGNTGAAWLSDIERLGADVQTEYATYQGVTANLRKGSLKGAARAARRRAFNATLRHLEALNEAGENAMRLALYRTAIEQGSTRNRAASLAKNTTVNFNRKGELGAQANALWLFYNAGVQGSAAIAHAHFKGKHKYQAWGISSAMAALGYSLSILAAGADEDEYEKTPKHVKDRNMVLPIPGTGEQVTIPVPYGYGFFFALGRGIADAQRTGEADELPWRLASSFIGEFTPFGGVVAGDEPDMKQATIFAWPTIGQIPLSIANNRTSFGSPMRPENSFKKHEPDRLKMWRGTEGTWADRLAGTLEAVGMDVSPETLKYLNRTFTGGAGNFVGSTVDAGLLGAQGATLETKGVPFLRSFYRENGVGDARSRFWRYQAKAGKAVEELDRAINAGDREQARGLLRENRALIAMDDLSKDFSELASAARDRAQQIRLSDLPIAEKRAQIKKIEEREAALYDRFVRIFKEKTQKKE